MAASDAVDSRVINNALSGTKDPIPDLPGPFPSIAKGTPCADADGDGMPDTWEGQRGLDLRVGDQSAVDRQLAEK